MKLIGFSEEQEYVQDYGPQVICSCSAEGESVLVCQIGHGDPQPTVPRFV